MGDHDSYSDKQFKPFNPCFILAASAREERAAGYRFEQSAALE